MNTDREVRRIVANGGTAAHGNKRALARLIIGSATTGGCLGEYIG
jgi:hypothetical protein